MKMKQGQGWKACYDEKTGLYGAQVTFRGSWDLYEISASVFSLLHGKLDSSRAEELIRQGRRLYSHVNDQYSPEYNVVLDNEYEKYCPWMAGKELTGIKWNEHLTDVAVEILESEKNNRNQRRKKREKRNK